MRPYTIDFDDNSSRSGCSAEFFPLIGYQDKGFKCFYGASSKASATFAWKTQKKLHKLGLAPKVFGNVRRVHAIYDGKREKSKWGFITEIANCNTSRVSFRSIQKLVNDISTKTSLDFWDCHAFNVGFVNIKGKRKLVCIDTGKESFDYECNAWGLEYPGPICNHCQLDSYNCTCEQ